MGVSRRNSGGVPAGFGCYFIFTFEEPISLVQFKEIKGEGGTRALAAGRRASTKHQQRLWVASSLISPEQAGVNRQEAAGRDFATIALVATINGEQVDSASDVSYEIGSGTMLDGQDTALRGTKAGDEVTFTSCLFYPSDAADE